MKLFTKQNLLPAMMALGLGLWQQPARAASPGAPADKASDPVVATGKGFVITRSQLNDAFLNYTAAMAARGSSIPESQRSLIKSNVLEELVVAKILTQKATPEDKAATWTMIDDYIAQARKAAPSAEAFASRIKASGKTIEQIRQQEFENELPMRVLMKATTNGIVISPAAVRKFYDDNPDKFVIPEEAQVSHVLILTVEPPDPLRPATTPTPLSPEQKKAKEKLAREIKARADKGEDFGKLVKQYTEDASVKETGGVFTFTRGRADPEFEAAAFSLKTNQISDVVETRYAYHIIKLLKKTPATKESFSAIESKIKIHLIAVEAAKVRPAYLAKIKAESNVALFDPNTGKPASSVAR
ncbi:MAG: peptidylprolyl isomerase [Verrucomicrobiota bacterium]